MACPPAKRLLPCAVSQNTCMLSATCTHCASLVEENPIAKKQTIRIRILIFDPFEERHGSYGKSYRPCRLAQGAAKMVKARMCFGSMIIFPSKRQSEGK